MNDGERRRALSGRGERRGEGGGSGGGEGAEAEGERGRVGERPEEAGELAPLSSPSPARGCGGDGPCSDPGRGNREGGEGEWEMG